MKTKRILWGSLVAAILVCVGAFVGLTLYMEQQNKETINEAGGICLEQMATQIRLHFSSALSLYSTRLDGIVWRVPPGQRASADQVHTQLKECADELGFCYVALYDEEGNCEILSGEDMVIGEKDSFLSGVSAGHGEITDGVERSFAVQRGSGAESAGEGAGGDATHIVLGVAAAYPMESGQESAALVVGLPIEVVSRALSLDVSETQVYSHIIRADGSFVLRNSGSGDSSFFNRVRQGTPDSLGSQSASTGQGTEADRPSAVDADATSQSGAADAGLANQPSGGSLDAADQSGAAGAGSAAASSEADEVVERLRSAMALGEPYSLILEHDGNVRNVCVAPLPGTSWYLVSVLPQELIGAPLADLVNRRGLTILVSCGLLIAVILAVFTLYFHLESRQMKLVEQARREADAASQAKSMFLSNMSHDIRTPMNAIMGLASVSLTKIGDDAAIESNLRKIELSSKHLLGLVNNVLDMSLIESGRLTLRPDCVALAEVVRNVAGVMQPQMADKGISFTVTTEGIENLSVMCDSVHLSQALLNLLSNALKFTPEGGTVAFDVTKCDCEMGASEDAFGGASGGASEGAQRERCPVRFVVRDTGIGMSEEFQQRIFGVFERENTTNAGKTEGSGLGMAITKSIVDAMGGTVSVKSKRGEGSEFALTIGFECVSRGSSGCAAADAASCEEPVGEESAHVAAEAISGKCILVAEDQELNWEVASALLESYLPVLEWAKDGRECVELFQASEPGHYDAILMDLQMPRMDGYQAAQAIRELAPERPDAATVPIIAMTADVFTGDIARSMECGMNAHVSKPIDVKVLVGVLSNCMTGN